MKSATTFQQGKAEEVNRFFSFIWVMKGVGGRHEAEGKDAFYENSIISGLLEDSQ